MILIAVHGLHFLIMRMVKSDIFWLQSILMSGILFCRDPVVT